MAATGVSPSELVSRAKALRPRLLERQEATERDTRYSLQTHADFLEAGFYRMLIPRMFGGLEVGVETFAKVMRPSAASSSGPPARARCATVSGSVGSSATWRPEGATRTTR